MDKAGSYGIQVRALHTVCAVLVLLERRFCSHLLSAVRIVSPKWTSDEITAVPAQCGTVDHHARDGYWTPVF